MIQQTTGIRLRGVMIPKSPAFVDQFLHRVATFPETRTHKLYGIKKIPKREEMEALGLDEKDFYDALHESEHEEDLEIQEFEKKESDEDFDVTSNFFMSENRSLEERRSSFSMLEEM